MDIGVFPWPFFFFDIMSRGTGGVKEQVHWALTTLYLYIGSLSRLIPFLKLCICFFHSVDTKKQRRERER